MKAQLDALLKQGAEDPDPEKQHIVAEALLLRRLRQMIQLQEETFGDTTLITCAEYQVFLDEQRVQGKYYQPDHWTGHRFPPGRGHAPVLGVLLTNGSTFCGWLTARENGPWRYRLPKEGEFQQEVHRGILDGFGAGLGYWLDESKGFVRVKTVAPAEAKALWDYVSAALGRAIAICLDIYLTLLILRGRSEGKIPAYEGILLVREQKRYTHELFWCQISCHQGQELPVAT